MNKPVMGAPKRGTDVLAELRRETAAISEAPAARLVPEPETPPAPDEPQLPEAREQQRAPGREVTIEGRGGSMKLDLNAIRAMKPRKEATIQSNARYPESLLEDIDLICRLTGMKKTDILVEGARKEVAMLKKRFGLD
ncbi:hypothetical protein AB6809_29870 [Paraburkholderia sp. RCC_158]|uniref:hypothetical protein n=1 Tax=Paraburkholderia sp. RCC_158 TaxID=3239220 RepID=UPI0035263E10